MNKVRLYKRLVSLLIFSFLILTVYNILSGYLTTERQVRQLTLERLGGIARQLASQVDGDQHRKVSTHFKEKDAITFLDQCQDYKAIHHQLSAAYLNFKLNSPIYTFVKSNDVDGHLEFIGTSNEKPYFRHVYSTFPKSDFHRLDVGGALDLYEDEFGHWLSAFAPIHDSKGEVVGYVQADEKFDNLLGAVWDHSFQDGLLNLLGLSVIVLLLIPLLKKIVRKEEQQKAKLAKSLEEITTLSKQLKKNEIALKESATMLEQRNKDLNDFAHIASHDLKAPMRNILSFSQLLSKKMTDIDDTAQQYLDFITSSANRAQRLITGLLKYSTADQQSDDGQYFNMREAVDEARLGLMTTLEERNVELVVKDMPELNGNLILISQVLQNLINNGIKYNQSDQPMIEIGSGKDAQKGVYFYVKDNGIGIPEEYQKDIFKMFKRLHTNQTYEGSGIGLAFCNRVINGYGGTIWLESKPDQGSTFFFTLPKAKLAEQTHETALKGARA